MGLARLIDRLSSIAAVAASLVIIPLILAMVYEVVSRYAFGAPTYWAFEVSYMMMGVIFFFGIGYALLVRQHVTVDFLNVFIPAKLVLFIRIISQVAVLVLAGWITWALYDYAVRGYVSGEGSGVSSWNPQIWPYRVVYVLGFALFTLQLLSEIIKDTLALFGRADAEREQ